MNGDLDEDGSRKVHRNYAYALVLSLLLPAQLFLCCNINNWYNSEIINNDNLSKERPEMRESTEKSSITPSFEQLFDLVHYKSCVNGIRNIVTRSPSNLSNSEHIVGIDHSTLNLLRSSDLLTNNSTAISKVFDQISNDIDCKNDENVIWHAISKDRPIKDDSSLSFQQNNNGDDTYLLYFTHSGFSNQLKGLENAAHLALATNRTLVLPPVLPHKPTVKLHELAFPAFRPRGSGSGCGSYDNYNRFVLAVLGDLMKANDPAVSFPTFMELFDFEEIKQTTGLSVIDMKDFVRESSLFANVTYWCNKESIIMKEKMVPECKKSKALSFVDLVEVFQNLYGKNHRVAIIGSAFAMPHARFGFQEAILPTQKILLLLKQIHEYLPEKYSGVHIRFRDDVSVKSCDDPDVKAAYDNVFLDLDPGAQNFDNPKYILIGNSHQSALSCFRHHAGGRYNALTVDDIIESDESLQSMVSTIKSEKSTVYLLLDQLSIALAEKVSFGYVKKTSSTFHASIRNWHKRRSRILEKIQIL